MENSLKRETEQQELTAAMALMVILCTLLLYCANSVSGADWHSYAAGAVFVDVVSVRVACLHT